MNYIIAHTDVGNGQFVIKPYTTNGPASPSAVAPFHPQAVSANSSLVLLGKGMYEYGDEVAANLIHLCEHFANRTAPKWAIQGQLWYKNVNYTDPAYPSNPTTRGLYICRVANSNPALAVWDELALSTLTGNINANNFTVINVANPVNPQDAVNLQSANAAYVNVTGDSMAVGANLTFSTGEVLGLPAIPSVGTAAASKTYIDTQLTAAIAGLSSVYVIKVGDTVTGLLQLNAGLQVNASNITVVGASVINLGGNKVTNAGTPTLATDLATKLYVDTAAGGVGGTDGTLISGSINALTGVLTLVSTISTPVAVPNIAPFLHDHRPEEIYININPVFNSSQLREVMAGVTTYPNVNIQDVVNALDQDMYQLKARNERQLITPITYAITGVVVGISGTFAVAGNHTATFFPAAKFVVAGNSGTGNGTYTVTSSVFATSTTTITISGTIPAGTTATGTISLLSYNLDLAFRVEKNKLSIFTNGIKQYSSERAGSNAYFGIPILPPYSSEVNVGDWTGLVNGAYSLNVAVNGGANTLVTVSVAKLAYAVTAVVTGFLGKWTVAGDQTTIFKLFSQIIIQGNVGAPAVATYTVRDSVYNGVSTVITVNETIAAGATATGNLYVAYTFYDLVAGIAAQFTALAIPATCVFENSAIFIYSHVVGTGSQISATNVTLLSTIQTNLATTEAVIFNNPPAITQILAYKEIGIPLGLSSVIEFDVPLTIGTITEISLMR